MEAAIVISADSVSNKPVEEQLSLISRSIFFSHPIVLESRSASTYATEK